MARFRPGSNLHAQTLRTSAEGKRLGAEEPCIKSIRDRVADLELEVAALRAELKTVRQASNEWLPARLKWLSDEANHEQNCNALDFDGDYRACVYPEKCTCRARLGE